MTHSKPLILAHNPSHFSKPHATAFQSKILFHSEMQIERLTFTGEKTVMNLETYSHKLQFTYRGVPPVPFTDWCHGSRQGGFRYIILTGTRKDAHPLY
jgi:hypothetical protein